jgi:hypothetical protein
MSAEWVSALAAVGTFVVIAVTAIAATIQLRHIRASNQLTGLLHFTQSFGSEAMQSANKFIEEALPRKLQDDAYVKGLMAANPDRREHPELIVCDYMEQQGSYVKFGMIDKAQYLDITGAYVSSSWEMLREVVAIRRKARNSDAMYENFEYIASLALMRTARRTSAFPSGVPRLLPQSEWRTINIPHAKSKESDVSAVP